MKILQIFIQNEQKNFFRLFSPSFTVFFVNFDFAWFFKSVYLRSVLCEKPNSENANLAMKSSFFRLFLQIFFAKNGKIPVFKVNVVMKSWIT